MPTFEDLRDRVDFIHLPPVVIYLGSTNKCAKQFQRAHLYDTIRPQPRMFLTISCSHLSDTDLVQEGVQIDKDALDLLHFQKIFFVAWTTKMLGIAGEVCILDQTDTGDLYIGESTAREIQYTHDLIERGYPLTIRRWSEEQEEVRAVLGNLIIP